MPKTRVSVNRIECIIGSFLWQLDMYKLWRIRVPDG